MKFEKIKYPDGYFTAKMVEPPLPGEVPIINHWMNSYEDLFYLMKIKDVCRNNDIDPILNIPNLMDAQADRRFHENESYDLKVTCDLINHMNFKEVRVFHPHNAEVVEMGLKNVKIVDNSEYIKQVLQLIKEEHETFEDEYFVEDSTILMSTDAGGFKSIGKLADKLKWEGEIFSASKSRHWDEEKQKSVLTQQIDKADFDGKDILIIDDLCVYGGTFVGLANLLKDRNCGKLYLAVSHITVPTPSKQLEESFHRVFTTDSKYPKYELNNVTVLPVPL